MKPNDDIIFIELLSSEEKVTNQQFFMDCNGLYPKTREWCRSNVIVVDIGIQVHR